MLDQRQGHQEGQHQKDRPAVDAEGVLGHLLITTNVFLSVVFLLDRFGSLGGYTMPQLDRASSLSPPE